MRHSSNHDPIAAHKVGYIVGKHRAIHSPKAAFALPPEVRMRGNRGANLPYFRSELLPEAALLVLGDEPAEQVLHVVL